MEPHFSVPRYPGVKAQLADMKPGRTVAGLMTCIIAVGVCVLLTLGSASAQSSISGPHKPNQIGGPKVTPNLVAPPRPAPPPNAPVASPPKNPTAASPSSGAPLRRVH